MTPGTGGLRNKTGTLGSFTHSSLVLRDALTHVPFDYLQ
jgi:hypothetical protein